MFAILIPFSYMWIPNQYTNIKDHEYHVDISSQAWQRRICGARRALITILSSGLPGSSNKRLSPWKTCCKAFNLNFSLTPNHSCWQLWSFRWCVEMSRVYSGQCQDSDLNWPMRGPGWPLTRGIGQWQPARTLTTAPISSSEGWNIIGDNISQVLMAQNTIPISRCEFQGYYHCLTFWPSLLQIVVFGILKG